MTTCDKLFRFCSLVFFIQTSQAIHKVQFYNDFEISQLSSNPLNYILGIDVSETQGIIDWSLLPKEKVEFALIKATQGAKFVDPMFIQNFNEAGKQDLRNHAYHVFSVTDSPESQVENIAFTLNKVGFQKLINVIAIDIEGDSCPVDVETMTQNIRSLAHQLAQMYPQSVFIHTRADYWDSCVNTTSDIGWNYLPLWVSYNSYKPTKPVLPKPWDADNSWRVWRFSQIGSMPGIKGLVDLNYARRGRTFKRTRVPVKSSTQLSELVSNNGKSTSDCCSGTCPPCKAKGKSVGKGKKIKFGTASLFSRAKM